MLRSLEIAIKHIPFALRCIQRDRKKSREIERRRRETNGDGGVKAVRSWGIGGGKKKKISLHICRTSPSFVAGARENGGYKETGVKKERQEWTKPLAELKCEKLKFAFCLKFSHFVFQRVSGFY